MNNYNKLLNNLEKLKLTRMREKIDDYIDLINGNKKDLVDGLYELTNYEIELMNEKRIAHSIQFAGFPFYKTLEDFDFSFQPSINKEEIMDLKI